MIIITTVSLHRLVQKYQSALYAENDKYVLLQNAVKHTDCWKRKKTMPNANELAVSRSTH